MAAADPHVHLESVACPDLAPIIQGGFPFDEQVVEIVRGYCCPAARGRRRHGDPRLDPLSVVRPDAPAHARTRRHAGLGGRGSRPQRRARARLARICSTPGPARAATASGAPPTSESFTRAGHPLPADAARRGRPRRPIGTGGRVTPRRSYGRAPHDLRPVEILPGFVRTATGSALISAGETRVICTASVQESVPRWLVGAGRGWVTAEYGMLPASTGDRKQRDVSKGRPDGRTVEIQRLIGRSLRGVIDFDGARRAHDLRRLRRAPGRRRDAVRVDHRRHRGAAPARATSWCRRTARPLAAERHGRGGLVRRRRRRAAARPRLRRGLHRGGRRQRRHDRRRRAVEVQATGERTPLSRTHLDELLSSPRRESRPCSSFQDEAVAAATV